METKCYIINYLADAHKVIDLIDRDAIEQVIHILADIKKKKGRIFAIGVGGGAGNASHAVNDFRKIAGIESYAPTDNVCELTARINDEGWESAFSGWLKVSRLNKKDCIFVFSVGGGDVHKGISTNLVCALKYAKKVGAKIVGIVGRNGGYTAQVADTVIIVPTVNDKSVTALSESFQALIWHLLVSHPALKSYQMKWESVK